ncbi:MAG: Potassium channel [Peltula sp. TS41687]|nr:MAG: Potassium channel [Peltula sp. TS41687]
MNDPGLDSAINDNAAYFEKSQKYGEEGEEEAEEDYFTPSRWWFSSTGFPLIAGTFGPISNAFSICALVQYWRASIPGEDEGKGTRIPDPKWLLAVNAISLVFALMANIALLLNMARRISFAVSQPITIVGWYVASFLLIALVVAAHARLKLPSPPNHVFTGAYYFGMIAAVLYFIVASLMVVTVYGAYQGRYSKEFKLTMSQRTLMLQTIAFVVYVLLGALVFSRIENWNYLDAVYWADVTLLTVGLGDFAPMTHLGRALLFPFSIVGTVFLGLVIGSIRALILERGKEKLEIRMTEKIRETAMRNLNWRKEKIKLGWFGKHKLKMESLSKEDRLEQEFLIMRKVQDSAAQRRRWTSLAISASVWVVLWLIGAVVFQKAERKQNWSYFQSIYFSYVALMTIGYGDLRPNTYAGKAFFVFWSLLAVPTLTILISNLGDTLVRQIRDLTLWVGSWTVLPGESSVRKKLKKAASKYRRGRGGKEDIGTEFAGGRSGETRAQGQRKPPDGTDGLDHAAEELESNERGEAELAARRGDQPAENAHVFHYMLIKEIRQILSHVNESPPRKYSYEEWSRFLELVGEDVGSAKQENIERSETNGRTRKRKPWSWLSSKSPLMSNKSEAEWVLEKLVITMEEKLKKQKEEAERESKEKSGQ